MSARDQQRAARVLVTLLSEDLPAATWTLYEHGKARLAGPLGISTDPAETKLSKLQEWVARLDADMEIRRYKGRAGGSASVTGYIDGVRVVVWVAFQQKAHMPTSESAARPSVRGGPDIGTEAEDGYRAEQGDPS